MKRILVIDGMYFANRTIFTMQAENETITLNDDQEQHNFLTHLNNSFVSLINAYNNDAHQLIDSVIFVTDFGSWRKDQSPFIPKYYRDIKDKAPNMIPVMKYKENRVDKREKSIINWDNFYGIVNKFFDEISVDYPSLRIAGCEGDDLIYLLSKTFAKSNYELLVFCTDGDIAQTANDNVIVYRNTKSKDNPYGEFVMTQNRINEYFGNRNSNPELRLLGKGIEDSFQQLIKMQLYSTIEVQRDMGKGITLAQPKKMLIVKCICGDAKDNIFPILRKPKLSPEKRNASISEKQLFDAIKCNFGDVSEEICGKLFEDKDARIDVFITLRSLFKMDEYPLDEMEQHFQHNVKLNVLDIKNLDRRVIDEFKEKMKAILPLINKGIDMDKIKKSTKTTRDHAVDLLVSSAPKDILN